MTKEKEWIEERQSGLVVVRHAMTQEEKYQRRADNKKMREIRKKTRKRKKHGRA